MGLSAKARAVAAPMSKQRQGWGPGGSNWSSMSRAAEGVSGTPWLPTSLRP